MGISFFLAFVSAHDEGGGEASGGAGTNEDITRNKIFALFSCGIICIAHCDRSYLQ